jgi:hypothetical protein
MRLGLTQWFWRGYEISLIYEIGSSALWSGCSYLLPDEQPLSPAAGNMIGQPFAEYDAH